MGVLTELYQVSPATLKRLRAEPALTSWLFGYTAEPADGARLGYSGRNEVVSAGIDKAWDDIRGLLWDLREDRAARALDGRPDPAFDEVYDEVRVHTPGLVARGARILAGLDISDLRARVVRAGPAQDLRSDDGGPMILIIDYVLAHLATVIDFWQGAAAAGAAVIASTG